MTGKQFNKIERKILRVLYQQRLPLTIYEVAKDSSISYPTSKSYLKKLEEKGLLILTEAENKPPRYSFNFELIEKYETVQV